jgi:predicted ribosomally synthesized peptide with SipW-like signal peptide
MKNNKENKRDKKVLIGAISIAAVIAAGSTFAWFTSTDEVTNRLTASSDYGVSISEDFAPPEQWLPGQTINKDVSAVNTGNISALVKLELEGALTLTVEGSGVAVSSFAAADVDTYDQLTPAEVTSLQAGGYLAYAPAGVTTTGDVGTDFTPAAANTGLYLFRREITAGATPTYDYSGYYFDGTNYYGLDTIDNADGGASVDVIRGSENATPTAAEVNAIKLRNYEPKVILANDSQLTWDYSKVASNNVATVKYHPTGVAATDTTKDILVNVNLDNIGDGTAADKWQYLAGKGFYYTNDVEPGATTAQLVDSVALDDSVQAGAYQDMKFDLTVKLNSVQVSLDDSQNEGVESASALGATASATNSPAAEISVIQWSAT